MGTTSPDHEASNGSVQDLDHAALAGRVMAIEERQTEQGEALVALTTVCRGIREDMFRREEAWGIFRDKAIALLPTKRELWTGLAFVGLMLAHQCGVEVPDAVKDAARGAVGLP